MVKRLSVTLAMEAFAMKAPLTAVPLVLTMAGRAAGTAAKPKQGKTARAKSAAANTNLKYSLPFLLLIRLLMISKTPLVVVRKV